MNDLEGDKSPIPYLENLDGKKAPGGLGSPFSRRRMENGILSASVKISVGMALLGYPN